MLSVLGVVGIFSSLLLFPYLQARVGTVSIYTWTMSCWPAIFALLPLVNVLARWGGGEVGVWIGVGVLLVVGRLACMAFA